MSVLTTFSYQYLPMLPIKLHIRDFRSTVPKLLRNGCIPAHIFNGCWDICRSPVYFQMVELQESIRINTQ